MNRYLVGLLVGGMLVLATSGCSLLGAEDAPVEGQPAQSQSGTPVGEPCDGRVEPIAPNQTYAREMHEWEVPIYPANCQYFCISIPPGQSRLRIDIRDFNQDLDLFVGFGSLEAVLGEQVVEGETYTWKSNAFGTGDEDVSIRNPEAGAYYIEVCSYEGRATPYELEATLR